MHVPLSWLREYVTVDATATVAPASKFHAPQTIWR